MLANGVNSALIRLSWAAAPNAASHHVYRGVLVPFTLSPVLIANVTGTIFEDGDQYSTPDSWYYIVKAVDSCGNEEP